MITSLLACTDGSPYSNVACDYAFRIAKALAVSVTGIHVLDIRIIEGPLFADISGALGASNYYAGFASFRQLTEEKGKTIQDAFLDSAREAGVTASFILETGHPVHIILQNHSKSDLLVMGRCGENEAFGHELIGSITDRLIRKASISCLVTPSKPMPITRILAACDDSPIASSVATNAADLARRLGVPLCIVTVAADADHSKARQALMAAEVAASKAGCAPAKTLLLDGDPADAILDAATNEHSDLVVMGAHSHTRIREWFVGCTALRVLADSALPALLVR